MFNLHKILCLVFLSGLLAACAEDDNKADTQAEVAASSSNIQVGVRPYYQGLAGLIEKACYLRKISQARR